jgi:hypothetical protein
MGRPVISTPYIHAEEALSNGIGTLVPFSDAPAISAALLDHLSDPVRLEAQSRTVWQDARSTIWDQNAAAVMSVFCEAKDQGPIQLPDRRSQADDAGVHLARVNLDGVAAMTDDVGMIQHSIHGIPDRRHGYCIDDNARALKLCCETRMGNPVERQRLCTLYAAFIEHAWNDEIGQFRNFMGYDRQWLETHGSEDSNGRTLWTLGHVMRTAPHANLRRWANGLFNKSLPLAEGMSSPRAIAFSMLGMAAVLDAEPAHQKCRAQLVSSVAFLQRLLAQSRRGGWSWFEPVLAYDNARLPQALIEAGRVLGDHGAIGTGLFTLKWLLKKQTAPAGHFRPVGSESFHNLYADPELFDQQPLEATATIDACASAHRVEGNMAWIEAAHSAYRWFCGDNDLGTPLASDDGSLCYDGLTPKGVNLNLGAESILALQMARHTMAELGGADLASDGGTLPQLLLVR